jgi:thiol:disulfide interchange protein DsbD
MRPMKSRARLFALLAAGLSLVAQTRPACAQEPELLEPEKAFAAQARPTGANAIAVTWRIADGYYMYRDKFRVRAVDGKSEFGALQIPAGKKKKDEFFGEVEIFEKEVTLTVPVTRGEGTFAFEAEGQGCNEPVGVCYPPQKYRLDVSLAGAAPAPTAAPMTAEPPAPKLIPAPAGALKDLRGLIGGAPQEEFLDPEVAFKLDITPQDARSVVARFQIAPGYYLYRDKMKFEAQDGAKLGNFTLPAGKPHEDESAGQTEVYYDSVEAVLPLETTTGALTIKAQYQGCAEKGICYPPITKTFTLTLAAAAAETGAVAASAPSMERKAATGAVASETRAPLKTPDKGFWAYVAGAFLTGILLTFTPCVLPMIPILSSIIVGEGEGITRARGGMLSIAYVLGTAVTYTAAGVVAGATGEQLQAYFQNPWAIGTIALVLTLLALSMFGLYELQLPSALQSRLTEKTQGVRGGKLGMAFVMGLLAALIVGACVSPLLIAALGVAISKGDPALGGAIMFSMALGMGVFLIALGFGAGFLIPRAGAWMDKVKYAFGVLLLGVAITLLGAIPDVPVLFLWSALFIVTAVYLGATLALPEHASGWRTLAKGAGVFLLAWGVLALLGAMQGNRDILHPVTLGTGTTSAEVGAQAAPAHLFTRVNTMADLDEKLTQARMGRRPVLLDYYADWCTDCVRMEKSTFANAGVRAAVASFTLLQADVTDANGEFSKAVKKRYGVFGPPAMLFFGSDGGERKELRRYGYMAAADFLKHIEGL